MISRRGAGRPLAFAALLFVVTALAIGVGSPSPLLADDVGDRAEHAAVDHEAGGGHEATEHEATEPAPRLDAKKLGLQFLNFGVLLFILVKFGGGAINKSLAARHHQLKADLSAAAALRATAEAKLSKQEARLASLEQEIAELRRGIKAEAEAEKMRLVAAAEERATRIKAETAFVVEQQIREAEARLRRESANTALNIAEDILRRSIGAPDQQRLLDTFVADVEHGSAGPAGKAA